ncbi:MAG: patatin-like phospholipase family protein [Hyphomicrobiaceae bacterium]|nr:patatin-like phospholipase family protein [Hyphomicrobiaceae bacterium]
MRKKVNLALQGGGSHGAFSWGVIDRLLEHPGVEIEAVTGASAGAINAVVLADGLADGCAIEARNRMRAFWQAIIKIARSSPVRRSPFDLSASPWSLDGSPVYIWLDLVSRLASPYDLNPFNINPLQSTIAELVDFERVRRSPMAAFVAATNVESGRTRLFSNGEMSPQHVMASACLPFLYQAVDIDGVPYWDGGYMGNPPLWPLFDHSVSDDVIIVQINPFRRPGAPRTARDITNRLNEITFNASLLRELRAVDFVSRLIAEGRLEGTGYRNVFTHIIEDEAFLSTLGASSKMNVDDAFIGLLFDKGRAAADRFIMANWDAVGERSTFQVGDVFGDEADALDGERILREAHFRGRRRAP